MATVSWPIVQAVIEGNGYYPGDEHMPPVVKIVQYENQWNGALAYGLIYAHEDPMRYHNSEACHNPQTIWVRGGTGDT